MLVSSVVVETTLSKTKTETETWRAEIETETTGPIERRILL